MMDKEIYSLKSVISIATKISVILVVASLYIHYFLPQNWGYFVKKPAQSFFNVYRVHNGAIQNSALIDNNMSYGIGISRKGRVYYKELINNSSVTFRMWISGKLN